MSAQKTIADIAKTEGFGAAREESITALGELLLIHPETHNQLIALDAIRLENGAVQLICVDEDNVDEPKEAIIHTIGSGFAGKKEPESEVVDATPSLVNLDGEDL